MHTRSPAEELMHSASAALCVSVRVSISFMMFNKVVKLKQTAGVFKLNGYSFKPNETQLARERQRRDWKMVV